MKIGDDQFKALWSWFLKFCHRFDLNGANLFDEGGEVDKHNPETLQALDESCAIIDQYDPAYVYNMEETRLFF